MILRVVWSANGDGRAHKASSYLLNEDTYRSVCVGNHPTKQIEQGAQYIIIYSMRKAFLEKAVVELVYKNDEKTYCLKK